MDSGTALQTLRDIKWFYQHEWLYSQLRDEEYRRDTRNVAFLAMKTELVKRLKRLQKNLVAPAKEVVEWQKERVAKVRERWERGEDTLVGHVMTLERNIPRITGEIEELAEAEGLEDLLVAVDTVINEIHYAYPFIKHVANVLGRAVEGDKHPLPFDSREPPVHIRLALDIFALRQEMERDGRLKTKELGYEGWTLLDDGVA